MPDELTELSASRLAAMMRRREVSPVEVVGAHLRRIERLNPGLNAVVTLAPDALGRAREIEAALTRGEAAGALAGLPVTVKDTIEVAGLPATCGSRVRADLVPRQDATAVARLRAAGAVILGKTNTAEMALDYTADNPVYGRTNNPVDAARTPGGSSGGCAAAVAARLAAGGLGSDLVGSIRIPAHFCGVAGLKPTAGRVPGAGHFPPLEGAFGLAAALGPLARRVEDLALFFAVLAGEDAESLTGDEGGARLDADAGGLRGRRVAWYADDGCVPVTRETRQAVERAARALAGAGLVVREERPPGVERGADLWTALFSYSTQRLVRAAYAGREAEAGAAARIILERAARAGSPPSADDFLDAWAERDRLRAALVLWMEDTPLLVAPVGAVPAPPHGARRVSVGGGEQVTLFRAFSYAQTFNTYDLPAVTIPAGRSDEGLPVGVQVVGRPRAERAVLAAAHLIEESLGVWSTAPAHSQ